MVETDEVRVVPNTLLSCFEPAALLGGTALVAQPPALVVSYESPPAPTEQDTPAFLPSSGPSQTPAEWIACARPAAEPIAAEEREEEMADEPPAENVLPDALAEDFAEDAQRFWEVSADEENGSNASADAPGVGTSLAADDGPPAMPPGGPARADRRASVSPAATPPSSPSSADDDLLHAVSARAANPNVTAAPALANVSLASPAATLQWVARASFEDPRTTSGIEGAAASLIDGKIYVSHGNRFSDSALLSVYDTAADTWTHGGAAAPDASLPRSELAGATLFGQHFAIGGRFGDVSGAIEAFDPINVHWSEAGSLQVPRAGMAAAAWDDHIYVAGGRDGPTFGSGTILSVNEVYDPLTQTTTLLAPMPVAVSDSYATVALDRKIYVFGGATDPSTVTNVVQIYDIAGDTWSFGDPMPTPRAAAMAGVIEGQIAVFGGYDPTTSSNLVMTELYDPLTNTWRAGPNMIVPVSEMAAGMVFDATGIYAIGTGIFGASGSVVQKLEVVASGGITLTLDQAVIDEGSFVSLNGAFTPLNPGDTHRVAIDWGDGSQRDFLDLAPGVATFNAPHSYLDDNPSGTASDVYTITVTAVDASDNSFNGSTTVTVNNVAATLGAAFTANWSATGDGRVILSGTIQDPGIRDSFTLRVDWGDGTPLETFSFIAGTTTFQESHESQLYRPQYVVTVTLSDDDGGEASQQVAVGNILSVDFVGEGTTGTLSADNPAGFGGGWRFFPDAVVRVDANTNGPVAAANIPRNIVRVRAILDPTLPVGTLVSFRSFDVDDPSSDAAIDPNDTRVGGVVTTPRGTDNRGYIQLVGGQIMPADSEAPTAMSSVGYQGQLRPVGGDFARAPSPTNLGGGVVTVAARRLPDGLLIAEVELATSFAPGDNFRVVASLNQGAVGRAALNETTGVPTTGDVPNFQGRATQQLSVWRYLHVEFDRMEPTQGDIFPGFAQSSRQEAGTGQWITRVSLVPRTETSEDQFAGGILRTWFDGNYFIISSTVDPDDNRFVLIRTAEKPNVGVGRLHSSVQLFEDDFTATFGLRQPAPTPRINPFEVREATVFALMQSSPDVTINKYAAAYIQPEYELLRAFNTSDRPTQFNHPVRSIRHFDAAGDWHVLDRYRRSALPALQLETDLFWIAYVVTGYEPNASADFDPGGFDRTGNPTASFQTALTVGTSFVPPLINKTIIFVETTRDLFDTRNPAMRPAGLTVELTIARNTVHEVGHQFRLVLAADGGDEGTHRAGPNIMNELPLWLEDREFVFAAPDIARLRLNRESP